MKTGQRLGAFLAGVAGRGLDTTLDFFLLGDLVGATANEVLVELVDYLSGNGATLDESVARNALSEVLAELFTDLDDGYEELREKWDEQLDPGQITTLMSVFFSQCIFQKFSSDLGDRIESNAVSASEVARIEQEVLSYIREMVRFELGEIDPMDFDPQGQEGEELIGRNLSAALAQLEAVTVP